MIAGEVIDTLIGRAPHGARGLKLSKNSGGEVLVTSRPARGAWIETDLSCEGSTKTVCRAPHGARGLKLA